MRKFKLLMLEDNGLDAELIKENLIIHEFEFDLKLVDTEKDFINALKTFKPNLILSDYNLPQFTGFEALEFAKKISPNIPFIIVTGALSEEIAADSIRRGAWDYVLKTNLARLSPAIKNAFKLKTEKDKNKAARKAIRESQAFNESLLQTSPDIIYIYNIIEQINVYSNNGIMTVLGYSVKEIQNFGDTFISKLMHPDDFVIYCNNTFPKYQTTKDGEFIEHEYRMKNKKGNWVWLYTKESIFKRLDNGKPSLIFGITTDITERKKIEQELIKSVELNKALTQTAADAIITTDFDGNVTSWNNAAKKLFGYNYSDIINNNVDIIIPSRYKERHREGINRLKTDTTRKLKNKSHEFYGLRNNGTEFPIEISFSKWEVSNQNFITSIIRDISERKKAELDLQKSYLEIEQLKKQLEEENIFLKEEISLSFNYEDMVYSSEEISDVLTLVEQVSSTSATVLILGETGTGKELIAKAIHNTSNRKSHPLIRVNCAAIPSELLESELFGHKKGSFTGATKDRIGKFQLANHGTLFLDEIGEMPLSLQPKILRAIQEGEIEPIGSSKIQKLDIRIIAATNKDLEKDVEEKKFRQDLFFRLNVFPIIIPPLRKRIEDIPVLIDHFLNKFCLQYRKDIKLISNETLQQLKVYSWPGNVRELENLVERAVITSNNNHIIFQGFENSAQKKSVQLSKMSLEEVQSNHIIKTLNSTQWKIGGKNGAAELLEIKPSTLRDRMKKFGIKKPKL